LPPFPGLHIWMVTAHHSARTSHNQSSCSSSAVANGRGTEFYYELGLPFHCGRDTRHRISNPPTPKRDKEYKTPRKHTKPARCKDQRVAKKGTLIHERREASPRKNGRNACIGNRSHRSGKEDTSSGLGRAKSCEGEMKKPEMARLHIWELMGFHTARNACSRAGPEKRVCPQ